MWSSVESELAELLSNNMFSVLLHDKSEYGDVPFLRRALKEKLDQIPQSQRPQNYPGFLFKAGILPEFPSKIEQLIPAQRERLAEAARLEARLLIGGLASSGGVRERRASAEIVSGRSLYRLWDSRYPSSETGAWWFSEGVYEMVKGLASKDQQEALRDLLAVSRDWSDIDRISVMDLGLGAQHRIPAVVATGLAQPFYSTGMWTKFLADDSDAAKRQRKDYYANLGTRLEGGKTQYYVAWTPKHLVRTHSIFP